MISIGTHVYYLDNHQIHSGNVIDIEHHLHGYSFSIDSYGTCEGNYRLSSDQIGRTIFLSLQLAQTALKKEIQLL